MLLYQQFLPSVYGSLPRYTFLRDGFITVLCAQSVLRALIMRNSFHFVLPPSSQTFSLDNTEADGR